MKTEKREDEFGFWTKYKQYAGNEIMLYVIMVAGILLGIVIFGWLF